ncbi:class I adenylate-forming enzyme family protein [Desulfococcus sp.]|uniref:class I adenylate-forming enzyme family protein n=1 Tax=Desulfococcus sp. TaxID=2025834 RepID=UPI0035933F08
MTDSQIAPRGPHRMTMSESIARVLTGPPHPELDFIQDRVSYGDLYGLAEAICRDLPSGCRAVCLCTEDRAVAAASLLAALAAGFTLVLPQADSARAAAEACLRLDVSVAVTDRPRDLPAGVVPLIPGAAQAPRRGLRPAIGPDAPFLKFFTGGSTGAPGIWSKTPRNLFAEALFHAERYGFGPEDRILATVSPLHIYGFLYTVLIPLVASSAVVAGTCTFPEEIRGALVRHVPTVFVSVPVHYRVLNGTRIPGASLRLALSSAGRLDPSDGLHFKRETGVGVTEIYGSTETGGIADRRPADGDAALRAFDIVDWRIAEERLCVRSPFISPEIETAPDGFFTTGDRAAAAGPDRFMLLGRADGVVKVGGNRVDLEVVRDALKGIIGVEEAVVLAVAGESGRENELYAVIQGEIDPEGLRRAALERIEPHALPRRMRIVDRIPVSSSGKYEKNVLLGLFTDENRGITD